MHFDVRDLKHNFLIIYAMCRSMKSFNCQSSLQILRISSVKFPSFLISEKTRLVDAEEKQNCTVWDWIPRYQVEKKMSQTIYFLSHCTYSFLWSYTVCFSNENCPYHPLFLTENLLFNWLWWPNDLMASITSNTWNM